MNEEDNDNWCGGIIEDASCSMAINYSGRIYPCIRYMNSSLNNKQEELYYGIVGKELLLTNKERENYNLLCNITRRS